jgi:hypothetical protein
MIGGSGLHQDIIEDMFNSAASSNQHKLPGFSLPLNFTPNHSENASVHPELVKWGAPFPSALEREYEQVSSSYILGHLNETNLTDGDLHPCASLK